jgi:alpha-tubulin suppressor-like RCC1 family protein
MVRCRIARRALGGVSLATALAVTALAAPAAQAASHAPMVPATPRSHLWVWGRSVPGLPDAARPVPVHGLGTGAVSQVLRSGGTVVVLLANGTVWTWEGSSATPVQVTPLPTVIQIAATTLVTAPGNGPTFYALGSDDTLWAWGFGGDGELGDGSTANSSVPVQVTGLADQPRIVSITAGSSTAYAITYAGTVWAWGAGGLGQLGDGSTANSDVPVQVQGLQDVTQVSTECDSAYVDLGGKIFGWGWNADGQLGDGHRANSASPVEAGYAGEFNAISVVAGCVSAYAILQSTGGVMAWGLGGQGELGNGHTATSSHPVPVTGLTGVTSLFAAYGTAYAIDSSGTLWAWGYGRQGNLGNGLYANSSVPVQVINISVPVTAVVAGQQQSTGENNIVAQGSDGSLWSWGNPAHNATGGGGSKANPGQIPRIPPVTSVFGTWFGAV